MKNSAASPPSNLFVRYDVLWVAFSLAALIGLAATWFFRHGNILWYGDAQCHLNISRSIIDSRTPGYDQLGTVWLPVLHVICLPFVWNDWLWSTGLAGAIPVALCFIVAGLFFYLAARHAYGSSLAAVVVVACFALNPNLLYLGSIPMTEVVFLAGLALLVFSCLRFAETNQKRFFAAGVIASWWMSLTRYDGWFLIPFAALWFAIGAKKYRPLAFVAFGAFASLAPLYWIGHNWYETANPLDFYNGPYSAVAIQRGKPYPGYHNWLLAAGYYAKAGQLCAGWCLALLGIAGLFCAWKKRAAAAALFLLLTPLFYIWSNHSSGGTPIFLPQLASRGYYNTRYGIAVVAFAAFAAGAIVLTLPARWKRWALALPLVAIVPWLAAPSPQSWICWKESQVNSVARRAWTAAAAAFMEHNYQPGTGILTESGTGDISGIFCRARIPLRQVLDIGNGPPWYANTSRPDLVHQETWAIAQQGDFVAASIREKGRSQYRLLQEIEAPGAPMLDIYRRVH